MHLYSECSVLLPYKSPNWKSLSKKLPQPVFQFRTDFVYFLSIQQTFLARLSKKDFCLVRKILFNTIYLFVPQYIIRGSCLTELWRNVGKSMMAKYSREFSEERSRNQKEKFSLIIYEERYKSWKKVSLLCLVNSI